MITNQPAHVAIDIIASVSTMLNSSLNSIVILVLDSNAKSNVLEMLGIEWKPSSQTSTESGHHIRDTVSALPETVKFPLK